MYKSSNQNLKVLSCAVCALLFIGLTGISGNPASDIMLKVPVRVKTGSSGQHYITGLGKQDFTLNINSQSRSILDFAAMERSLSLPPATADQGRVIALSFDVSSNYKGLSDGVIQFIEKRLTASDTLLLRTPVDLYTFKIDSAKDKIGNHKIGNQIRTVLENDQLQQKRKKQEAINGLNQLIQSAGQKLAGKKMGIRSALLFANHFHEQWRSFYKRFLMANLEHFSSLAERSAQFKGHKWLVHFQERTTLPMWANFQDIRKKLNAFAAQMSKDNGGARMLKETLDKIDRSMSFSGDFPMAELMNRLLGVNLGCHMLFLADSGGAGEPDISRVYETILTTIARHTGGTAAIAYENQFDKALDTIAAHKDYYYRLVFAFNGKAEDKTLKIGVNKPDARLYYKRNFKASEFQWLMKHLGIRELKVANYSLKDHTLGFTIFGSGLLKVEIQLIDSAGAAIYRTAKTLNASGPSTTISLQLPPAHKGYFKLSISVTDKRTQKTAEMNKYVKL